MASKKANEHGGHRQRVKKKFLEHGLDVFDTHEALELYLYYAIPRHDTNPSAHRLIERYSTLSAVCDAPRKELIEDFGLSEHAADWLKLLPQTARLYVESKLECNNIAGHEELKKRFLTGLYGKTYECLALILFDAKCKVVYFGVISMDSENSDESLLQKIVDLSLRHHAKYLAACQNYPNSSEKACLDFAWKIIDTLKNMGVRLLDYFVAYGNACLPVYP